MVALNFGHAKPVGIDDFFDENLGALSLLLEVLNGQANVILNDVVAQDHANRLAVGKIFSQT